ncbi:MAG: DUF99 family protein [Euryarchaeota archaeon]|nr:DUF99 family protein [Euryarchaeota archaeon]
MKPQIRVLAIDDGPFTFSDKHCHVVGVVVRLPSYIEAVMKSEVAVDGRGATSVIAKMVNGSRYKEQVKLILLDGIALGGFNIIDIDRLNEETGLSVATVTREPPDMGSVKEALRANFEDWEERWEIVARRKPRELDTGHKPIYVDVAGIDFKEAEEIIRLSVVRGALPEPLRIAHLIATALAKGESKGRA